MPVPRSETAQRKIIRGAMKRRPSSFKRGSAAAIAREALAKKLIHKGHTESEAYAIATAAIKKGLKR